MIACWKCPKEPWGNSRNTEGLASHTWPRGARRGASANPKAPGTRGSAGSGRSQRGAHSEAKGESEKRK